MDSWEKCMNISEPRGLGNMTMLGLANDGRQGVTLHRGWLYTLKYSTMHFPPFPCSYIVYIVDMSPLAPPLTPKTGALLNAIWVLLYLTWGLTPFWVFGPSFTDTFVLFICFLNLLAITDMRCNSGGRIVTAGSYWKPHGLHSRRLQLENSNFYHWC